MERGVGRSWASRPLRRRVLVSRAQRQAATHSQPTETPITQQRTKKHTHTHTHARCDAGAADALAVGRSLRKDSMANITIFLSTRAHTRLVELQPPTVTPLTLKLDVCVMRKYTEPLITVSKGPRATRRRSNNATEAKTGRRRPNTTRQTGPGFSPKTKRVCRRDSQRACPIQVNRIKING